MTPQEEIKLIKEDLKFNKEFKFKYEPLINESSFKNQALKDIVSTCYAASLEVDPTVVQELIHAEIRARTKALVESKLKGRSVADLAEASAEINVHLLEGLLKIKEARLVGVPEVEVEDDSVATLETFSDVSEEVALDITSAEIEIDTTSVDFGTGALTPNDAIQYVDEEPKKKKKK